MKATIIRIIEKTSKFGGIYHEVAFKECGSGKFYRSCIFPKMRNYSHWENLLVKGNVLDNLKTVKKNGMLMVDADSVPRLAGVNPSYVESRGDKPEAGETMQFLFAL